MIAIGQKDPPKGRPCPPSACPSGLNEYAPGQPKSQLHAGECGYVINIAATGVEVIQSLPCTQSEYTIPRAHKIGNAPQFASATGIVKSRYALMKNGVQCFRIGQSLISVLQPEAGRQTDAFVCNGQVDRILVVLHRCDTVRIDHGPGGVAVMGNVLEQLNHNGDECPARRFSQRIPIRQTVMESVDHQTDARLVFNPRDRLQRAFRIPG